MTRTERTGAQTVTEIEVYDTQQPADSVTGRHPVKARIRQRKTEGGESTEVEKAVESGQSDLKAEVATETESDTESRETVTAPPSAWEKFKNIFMSGAALLLLAALAVIVYKFFKRKK